MSRPGFGFSVAVRDGEARSGILLTPHGQVETPAFMPVATYGAVRGVDPRELRDAGARIALANTYHLHERPGEDVIATLEGLNQKGLTLVVVTHDPALGERARRRIRMDDGAVLPERP